MARIFNGSSDFLNSASAINLSAENKISFSVWMWLDSGNSALERGLELGILGSVQGSFGLYTTSGTSAVTVAFEGNVGQTQANYAASTSDAWHHYIGTVDVSLATDELELYRDGVLLTASSRTNHNNTNNLANQTLYLMRYGGGGFFAAGRVAEVAMWPGQILNASEAAAVFRGVNPRRIRPESNPYYWPVWGLHSPEISLRAGGPALTVTGATQTNHAPARPFTQMERTFALEESIPPAGGFGQPTWRKRGGVPHLTPTGVRAGRNW